MIPDQSRHNILILSSMVTMLLLLFSPLMLSAQEEEDECHQPSKKAQKYYDEAIKYNLKGEESYTNLIKAVEADPEFVEAYSALAYVNVQKAERSLQIGSLSALNSLKKAENNAVKYWKTVIELCPSYRNWEAHFLLGEFYFHRQQYDDAGTYLKTFMSNTNPKGNADLLKADEYMKEINVKTKLERKTNFVRDSLLSHKVDFNPVKVGGASTANDEFLPVLSPDNRYLFFTRREMVDTRSIHGRVETERFTRSENNYNNTFTHGEPMPPPFNQGAYQGGVSVSVDNKLIFVTVVRLTPQRDGTLFSDGDIFYSEFKNGEWGPLTGIDILNRPDTWEGQPSISADNKTLYFSSARPPDGKNNYGGMDLYKSERDAGGQWGPAINLGPTINTSGNEKTPFLHSDSYTLYFSSDQHPGVGGFDIFYAKMDNDGTFYVPKNIGYPINTEKDEHGFVVSTDGKYGYFASNLDGTGLDIYTFELPEDARPEHVIFVRGEIVTGKDAAKGLEITLKNTETEKEINAVVDEETGEYVGVIAVKEGEDAIMTAKKEGYAFSSQYVSSTENLVGKPIQTELEVREITVGETYRINNINFATDSYVLNKQARIILNEFYGFLQTNPGVKVAIQGHTDDVGNADDNMVLSNNRAEAVFEYLVEKGIKSDRLTFKGYGQTQPVESNESETGRAKNRRTEFLIVAK